MENKKKRIVVVLGMHRSGTSALTRGLKVLGVDLGDNFWPAASDNEKGFWEAPDIVLFNETILRKLNSKKEFNHHYSKIGFEALKIRPIGTSGFINKELNSYLRSDVFLSERQIAIDILKNKLKDDVIFGFKDPRVSILLPFWQSVFEELNLDDSYIISVRNPLSVAESLLKRNNISADVSMLLWYKHMLSSIFYTQDKKNVFVHYDDLLENPKHQLERISQFLFLPMPESSLDEFEEYAHNFLTSNLRHHEYSIHDLVNNSNVPKTMTELYFLLDHLSKDALVTNSNEFKEQWKLIEESNSTYIPLLTIIDRLEKDKYDLFYEKISLGEERDTLLQEKNNLSEEKIEIIKQKEILTQERNDFIHKLNMLTHEKEILFDKKNSLMVEKESLVQEKENLIKVRDAFIVERDSLSQEKDTLIKTSDTLRVERDGLNQEKEALIVERNHLNHEKDVLIKERNNLMLEKQIITQERDGINHQKEILTQERDKLIQEKDILTQEKDRLIQEKDNLNKYLEMLWNINQKTTNSISWKITRPFRFFKKYIVEPKKLVRLSIANYIFPVMRFCYHKLPMSYQYKTKIKNAILGKSHSLFKKKHQLSLFYSSQNEKIFHVNDILPSTSDSKNITETSALHKSLLENFDPEFYLFLYPDLAAGKVDPFHHYRNHGINEGRMGSVPVKIKKEIDNAKETILIVSHDASRTGAPILAWNICEHLKDKFNVITLLLGPGNIECYFEDSCTIMFGPTSISSRNTAYAEFIINKITDNYKISYAFVNSMESRHVLEPLHNKHIPSIFMIHEFFSDLTHCSYEDFVMGLVWSGTTVFSANIVRENAKKHLGFYDQKLLDSSIILNQGKSKVPSSYNISLNDKLTLSYISEELCNKGTEKSFIVLGGGTVQSRKGVDLFFETALEVKKISDAPIIFIWFGHECGKDYYNSIRKFIKNDALKENCYLFDPIENFEDVYKFTDLFFMSSRSDPLPNVAIDAMHHSIPVICFSGTTGIEEILRKNEQAAQCVVSHLNTKEAALKILNIYESKALQKNLSNAMKDLYKSCFEMSQYVHKLLDLCKQHLKTHEILKLDFDTLMNCNDFIHENFHVVLNTNGESRETKINLYLEYARKTSNMFFRKLFLGLDESKYIKLHGLTHSGANPLTDFIRNGRPQGPWIEKFINTSEEIEHQNIHLKAALHIHVFYPELLKDILTRLSVNNVNCDVFISVPSDEIFEQVERKVINYENGKIFIKKVPNKGRNFGPFLTEFSTSLKEYDVVGHFHTKKSAALLEKSSDKQTQKMIENWRVFLLENLIGGKNLAIKSILSNFQKNPHLGLVFPFDPNRVGWTENKACADKLAYDMKLSELPEDVYSFPVGSMFWVRPEALNPLFDLNLTWNDYPEEPLPYDGTMLHAIERLLPIIANNQNYDYALIHTPGITR